MRNLICNPVRVIYSDSKLTTWKTDDKIANSILWNCVNRAFNTGDFNNRFGREQPRLISISLAKRKPNLRLDNRPLNSYIMT